jgi:hypothetical protein
MGDSEKLYSRGPYPWRLEIFGVTCGQKIATNLGKLGAGKTIS